LLSQSFFKKKMRNSVDAVVEELEKQVEEQATRSGSPGPLSGVEVISCGNSIAVESEFAYSQADHDGNNSTGKRGSDQVSWLYVLAQPLP
jgi:hypothetical protein